jgi:hypothetical protein
VAAPLPFAENEIRLLTALLRARVRFMVVGLSAATLQGAPVVTQDVDLWFEQLSDLKISQALQTVGAAYVAPSVLNPPMLAGAGAELFDIVLRMDGLGTFVSELKHCVDVPLGRYQLKVLSLDRILVSKLAANRPKDQLTIPVLRDALATTKAIKPPVRKQKAKRSRLRGKP